MRIRQRAPGRTPYREGKCISNKSHVPGFDKTLDMAEIDLDVLAGAITRGNKSLPSLYLSKMQSSTARCCLYILLTVAHGPPLLLFRGALRPLRNASRTTDGLRVQTDSESGRGKRGKERERDRVRRKGEARIVEGVLMILEVARISSLSAARSFPR